MSPSTSSWLRRLVTAVGATGEVPLMRLNGRWYGTLFRGQTKDVIHEELRARFIEELDYAVTRTTPGACP